MNSFETPITNNASYHIGDNPVLVVEARLAQDLERKLYRALSDVYHLRGALMDIVETANELISITGNKFENERVAK